MTLVLLLDKIMVLNLTFKLFIPLTYLHRTKGYCVYTMTMSVPQRYLVSFIYSNLNADSLSDHN